MAKEALYWTLVRSGFGHWQVIKVTSIKFGRMVYGADMDGMATHTAWRNAHGQFHSEADARAAIGKVAEIRKDFDNQRAQHKREIARLDSEERAALKALFEPDRVAA